MDEASRKPSYRMYSVIKRSGNDDRWVDIGAAFTHRDGYGLTLTFDALPLDGQVVLRKYYEKEE